MKTIVDLLDDGARGTSTIRFLPAAEPEPFGDLWRDALGASGWIASRMGTGGAVAALLDNDRQAVRGLLGIWLSGNTLVSLPRRPRAQDYQAWLSDIRAMCELAGVKHVLVPGRHRERLETAGLAAASFDTIPSAAPAAAPDVSGSLIQFTSGSTTKPKGVLLSGTAVAVNVLAIRDRLQVGTGDIAVSWLPLSHDMGLVGMLLVPLASGAPRFGTLQTVIMPPGEFLRNPAGWLTLCSAVRATITTAPNFAFDLAVRARAAHRGTDLSPLRICITGAERVLPGSVRQFVTAFADAGLSEMAVTPAYGMAENTLAVTLVAPETCWQSRWYAADGGAAPADVEVVSTGRPLSGVEVRVDPAGEIQLKSPSLLVGYLGGTVPMTDDGWFRTRDLGFLADGELYVMGRADDSINVGGRNVFSNDIEAAVDHQALHPGGVAAVPWGSSGVAVVAESAHARPSLDGVAQAVTEMVTARVGVAPSAVFFVRKGGLPRTTSGKLQRRVLAAQLADGTAELLNPARRTDASC
jgi:acyl-CoA synthetase (AMP-forming)/AMP-acid ligase II